MTRSSLLVGTSDGTRLIGQRWTAEDTARAAVVLAHGMGEHSLRYDRLGKALSAAGIDMLAVDQRGHGRTAAMSGTRLGSLGPAGWNGLAADFALVVRSTRKERPDIPIVVLGHSMGSWVVQQFLLDHSADVTAAVLSGTAALELVLAGVDPTRELDLSDFNAPFAPGRTGFEWLSRDPAEVDQYVAEPMCGFGLDPDGVRGMMDAAPRLVDTSGLRAGLPLYVLAGSDDPVNGGMAALGPLVDRYRAAGVDVTTRIYPGGRHEMFNETNRDEVVADLIDWLNRYLPPA
jgi:alpha-beta hydrolase superfamily lysophospholipase